MTSKIELERELDKIPADYPYDKVAFLREMHRLFHLGTKNDKGVPYSSISVEEVRERMKNIKPTEIELALELAEEIEDNVDLLSEGTGKVLELVHKIYSGHYPPQKINHSY